MKYLILLFITVPVYGQTTFGTELSDNGDYTITRTNTFGNTTYTTTTTTDRNGQLEIRRGTTTTFDRPIITPTPFVNPFAPKSY